METSFPPRGWHLHHNEQFIYQSNAGAPSIRLKFFHYPSYRQTVIINQLPKECKLKKKGNNTFFLYQKKHRTKGTISLERIISVYPQPSSVPLKNDWGIISATPRVLQQKYKQNSKYWPIDSETIQPITKEHWFGTDDLSLWTQSSAQHILKKIKYPEKQDKRLGADQAVLTGVGDCDEFTDLFITLARIRGIPCRRLTGYVIAQKSWIPEAHAWGELYSPNKGWIPIDIALHNVGNHTVHYIIRKIEEFNPSLRDYQIQKQSKTVHYQWELPDPIIIPLY
ncbi:MAG: transglutaminase-like domain-containing protein [Methanobacteriota archaeon]